MGTNTRIIPRNKINSAIDIGHWSLIKIISEHEMSPTLKFQIRFGQIRCMNGKRKWNSCARRSMIRSNRISTSNRCCQKKWKYLKQNVNLFDWHECYINTQQQQSSIYVLLSTFVWGTQDEHVWYTMLKFPGDWRFYGIRPSRNINLLMDTMYQQAFLHCRKHYFKSKIQNMSLHLKHKTIKCL